MKEAYAQHDHLKGTRIQVRVPDEPGDPGAMIHVSYDEDIDTATYTSYEGITEYIEALKKARQVAFPKDHVGHLMTLLKEELVRCQPIGDTAGFLEALELVLRKEIIR
jgi:hypothetical protein